MLTHRTAINSHTEHVSLCLRNRAGEKVCVPRLKTYLEKRSIPEVVDTDSIAPVKISEVRTGGDVSNKPIVTKIKNSKFGGIPHVAFDKQYVTLEARPVTEKPPVLAGWENPAIPVHSIWKPSGQIRTRGPHSEKRIPKRS